MMQRSLVCLAVFAALLAAGQARADTPVAAAPSTTRWHDSSMAEYRDHLVALTTIVQDCEKARDAKTCDSAQVGQDDRVPFAGTNGERRLVRYGWLRVLLSQAQEKDKLQNQAAAKPGDKSASNDEDAPSADPNQLPKLTTTELLTEAEKRLAYDTAQADSAATPTPAHTHERAVMKQVLAGRDFRNLQDTSLRDTLMEKLASWLNRIIASISRVTSNSIWIGRVVFWGFILAVCVALVWGLLQLERRWRIRLIPDSNAPAPGAASARDWQLWLEDARQAAAAGLWREAIHYVYWASISRLESRRLWPADRARTPREYLALVAQEDPRQPGLAALTASFERFWYGGRSAAQSDYMKAENLAAALIANSGPPVPEGGTAQ